ncbi:MADF domain-containing protein [Caenorhabditis elegans]|uniref:MADF domain-containing protein n=1 Tax=Caenorhabditis elegans TaxID=6239 RepID=H2KZH8_CAEEL|nr:MADF domain-containing protein [Caenorhabditis elegans]CCD68237.2 MADF domain-containing protein [Caenorhabditis elegans]|eukprot:NP_500389.2 MADF domain transcription factor [Caenorhabditis elegans]
MSEHSEDTEDIKPTISTAPDDCMESDPIKEINFLLASSKNMKIEETPVFNIRLIAEVKARPFLYDQSDEGYNLLSWRNSAWNEIAENLETTSEHVKTRWKTLRDRYKKEEKKERVSKKASSWVFQRPLKFIQAHLKDRHTDETDSNQSEPAVKPEPNGHVSPMEAAMSFIENELIRTQDSSKSSGSTGEMESSSASTASSASSSKNTGTQEGGEASVITPPPLPIPMAVTPSPSATSSASNGGPAVKRSRVSITEGMTPVASRNAAAAAAASLGLSFFPGLSQWATTREEEEDEIFARMISIKLSKLDARTKEVAKLQVLKAIFDAQFTPAPT